MTRLQRVTRREALVWDASFLLTVGWIVFGALPLVGILVLSLVFGNYPTDADPSPEGYPAFPPPWWAMYPLVAAQVAATVMSLPLPMRGRRFATRSVLLVQSAFITVFTFSNGGLAFLHHGMFWSLEWLGLLSLLCCIALLLRMLAGWLRLVPRSWREYIDDEGNVIAPSDLPRDTPIRPWDGVNRLLDKARR